jgi:hypothetical protein
VAAAYKDNFGFWDIDGQEEQAFFEYVQRTSVHEACERCGCPVRLMPSKTVCASCSCALECGAPAGGEAAPLARPSRREAATVQVVGAIASMLLCLCGLALVLFVLGHR